MAGIDEVVTKILALRACLPQQRSLLVGISGIDGSGKGYVTLQIGMTNMTSDWASTRNDSEELIYLSPASNVFAMRNS